MTPHRTTNLEPLNERTHTIVSGDATLHVVDAGPLDAPLVLFVHGYPDDHHTWDLVRAALAGRYRVATFDVRGMGASRVPASPHSHDMRSLLDDIDAVATSLLDDESAGFHLVAHDWGSIMAWSYVTDERRVARVRSYTSISGSHLGVVGPFLRASLRDPRRVVDGLRQLRHSSYIAAFQVPGLAERVWRRRGDVVWRRALTQGGVPGHDPLLGLDRDAILAIALPGLELYRQNIRPDRMPAPPAARSIAVPVQLIVASDDAYVSPSLARASGALCSDRYEREIAAGHWVHRSHPHEVASWIGELIESTRGGAPLAQHTRSTAPSPTPTNRGTSMQGQVVLITGAAGGIGRATAYDAAAAGATVVLADRDKQGLDRTAEMCEALGGTAEVHQIDVTDRDAMIAFAEAVHATHGAVDVLVNNAGVGMAGPFTAMTLADWDWIRAVNLDGVITGCHLFVAPMIERGRGHVVNVASAAGYAPARNMTAYNATKFAVVGFTEALAADLSGTGVHATAICPGIVDTGIIGATRFIGDGSPEETRARVSKLYRRRGFGPDKVAAAILGAVRRGHDGVLPVGPEASALYRLRRFAPRLAARIARSEGPLASRTPRHGGGTAP